MQNVSPTVLDSAPHFRLPSEMRHKVFLCLLMLLFAAEGFNFFSYPLLGFSAFSALYCFFKDGLFSKLKLLPMPLVLPFFLITLTAVSPGCPFKDLPVADKMLAAYLTGLGAAIYLPGQFHFAMLALPVSIGMSFLIWGLSGFSDSYFLGERLVLFSGNPNKLSYVASYGIIIAVVFRQYLQGLWLIVSRVALAFCILIIVLTSSRASIIGLMACLVLWTLTILRKRLGRILLLFLLACLSAFWCLPEGEIERMRSATDPLHDTAFQKRLFIWSVALNGIRESPLLGNSIRGFRNYYGKFIKEHEKELVGKPFFEKDVFDVSHPHNIFLGIGFGYGLFGSFLMLLIFFSALKSAFYRGDFLFFSVIVFNLVSGMFEFYLHRVSGVLFIYFPLGLALGFANHFRFRSAEDATVSS